MNNKRKVGPILGIASSVISIITIIAFAVIMVDHVIEDYLVELIKENPSFLITGTWKDVKFVLAAYTFGITVLVIIFNIVSIVFTTLYLRRGILKPVAVVVNMLVISPFNIIAGVLMLKSDD